MNYKGFYFITDSSLTKRGIVDDVKEAVKGGATIIQYREKCKDTGPMVEEALKIKACCKEAALIINDRVDVALAVDADGVHLGQNDLDYAKTREILGEGKIIGVTVHTVDEAKQAEAMGADYLGVSPIFETKTKPDAGPAAGLELIKNVKANTSLPIVAIGGITLDNAKSVIDAGADTICAMSATIGDNVEKSVREFCELI